MCPFVYNILYYMSYLYGKMTIDGDGTPRRAARGQLTVLREIMKKISLILIFIIILTDIAGIFAAASYTEAGEGVLNVSPTEAEQVRLCSAVLLDSIEASESERTPDEGTVAEITGTSALEGEKSLRLSGNGSAGVTFTMTKKRNTENTRSAAICLYAEPVQGAVLTLRMTLRGSKKSFDASAELPQGTWCVAYLPLNGSAVNIDDVHISVSADRTARVAVTADWLHTSIVDGLPDRLRYFASDFSTHKGSLEHTEEGMVFRPSGSGSYIESAMCRYMTGGVYNCITFEMDNQSDMKKMMLRLKLDGQYSYSEEDTHTLAAEEGEGVYRFPIDGLRSGTSVEQFRLEFPGYPEGKITIKRIYFDTYRFPAAYKGNASVTVTDDAVTVSGSLPDYPSASKRICLYRLAVGEDDEEPGVIEGEPCAEASVSSSFEFTLPRTENGADNALFRYVVVYEGKTSSYTACAATALPSAGAVSLPYKGIDMPDDVSVLPDLFAGAVYVDLDMGALFSDSGAESIGSGSGKRYLSDEALEKYDQTVSRITGAGACVVLRLVYSPFSDSDKYYFTAGTEAIPDLTTYEGTAHFYALISYLSQRYAGSVKAIVPCGPLDSKEIVSLRGLSVDAAEKYACSVYGTAVYAASKHGVGVLFPASAAGADVFLGMLREDIPEGAVTVYAECADAEEAAAFAAAAGDHSCGAAVRAPAEDAEALIRLYYGSGAAAICASDVPDGAAAGLFAVIDTDKGVSEADLLAKDAFPDGISAVYPVRTPTTLYTGLGELTDAEMPYVVTTLYDGTSADGWICLDSCRDVFADTVNSESAAALSFDFTDGGRGTAIYSYTQGKSVRDTLYVRLYADYLPEESDSIAVKLTARCGAGRVSGVCTLEKEKTVSLALDVPPLYGGFRELILSVDGGEGTPRISVLGIYTVEPDSGETLTEQETETLPEPETQRFDTAPATETEAEEGGSGMRLYIIAILVILGMFLICGAVIFALKKIGEFKDRKDNNTDTGEEE